MLKHIEARLSTVPRWSVVETIVKQTVDQHSYRVAIIAVRMASDLFRVNKPTELLNCVMYGLLHDSNEGIYGDVPSYMGSKRALDAEAEGHPEYNELNPSAVVEIIVKVADLTESLIFLNREVSMGNRSVSAIIDVIQKKLSAVVEELAEDKRFPFNAEMAHGYILKTIQTALGIEGCQQNPMVL